jgi:hypothetical protein
MSSSYSQTTETRVEASHEPGAKRGRTFPGALLMLFPLLSLALLIAYLQDYRQAPGAPPRTPAGGHSRQVEAWEGQAELTDGGLLTAKLWRLHADPARQQFDTHTVRRHFGIDEGEPWHIELSLLGAAPAPLELKEVHVRDSNGPRLAGLSAHEVDGLFDPVSILFRAPGALSPGAQVSFRLFGMAPGEAPELVGVGAPLALHRHSREVSTRGSSMASLHGRASNNAVIESSDEFRKYVFELERAAWEKERARLEKENYRLMGELEESLEERVAREEDFMRFTESLASIIPPEAPPEVAAIFSGLVELPEPEPEPEPEAAFDPLEVARRERSQVIGRKLRALLTTERVDSLDLLEVGLVDDGFIGPVVFRQLDGSGRPVGSMSADRLRLEGSRAGRTLTIVLEAGYERRDGQRIPFAGTQPEQERGGERRIFLQQADPRPWFEACPELFAEESLASLRDDGRWHVFLVQRRINELFESDTALGYFRLVALGGVLNSELRDVELEQLDPRGHLQKRLFADRMSISLAERGVLVQLMGGIQMKGGRKFDFLDGRYRIFLPSADREAWTAAGLPGLVPAKESSAGSHVPLNVDRLRR